MGQSEMWEKQDQRDLTPAAYALRSGEWPNGASEPLVRALAHALQASGAVETVHASSLHPADGCCAEREFVECSSVAAVSLHMCNEDRWREVVMTVVTAVRTVPGVSLMVSFAQPGELRLEVFPWLPVAQRQYLLDMALREATQAVRNWCKSIDGPAAG